MSARQFAAVALLLLTGCKPTVAEQRVDPARYDAFYLWAGVPANPAIARAKTVYLEFGEVRRGNPDLLVPLRAPPRMPGRTIWLVVRTARIDWSEAVYRRLNTELARWEAGGNPVAGVQIDFDASTHGLDGYARFLADLRGRLPQRYKLSITGLMDWGANGDPAALGALAGVVDEVVVQTYQGSTTIPGYDRYVERLASLPIPHRIALIEGGLWREPAAVRRDPGFRGYVVFLTGGGRR